MIYLAGLVGFLLVLTAEAGVGDSSSVSFCTETPQCLLFNLTCKNDMYEVRHYDHVNLVSTSEDSWWFWSALVSTFRRLFRYIRGSNVDGEQIQMTSPVILKIGQKSLTHKRYTMSFVLPSEHQANPPLPNDEDVVIDELRDVTVYVKTFGGFLNGMSIKYNMERLNSSLESANATIIKDYYYVAGYNSPMSINKHNEVWIVADGEPKCSTSK